MGDMLGLSPRGRGNRRGPAGPCAGWRSIPAWAGEPGSERERSRFPGVYPRVGGGTAWVWITMGSVMGLSPRGRGNPVVGQPATPVGRSIPAWAGEPGPGARRRVSTPVYPRGGGGTRWSGSQPRSRGGLSPRGRGNLHRGLDRRDQHGSIPAGAGEPLSPSWPLCQITVYPRGGGGNLRRVSPRGRGNRIPTGGGLSPRGRGNH